MNELKCCIRALALPQTARAIVIATGLLFSLVQTSQAGQAPLRFAVNEGWTMPMMQITDYQPESG
ncbi:amino acid ABC transporter substrate-binding protein, partial [Pseudomonas syringae pv. actinidiae]|nr:amino acid ABC transporter substrate-binding protein [Pseudomonas syringae pv. actinidiae]